MLQTVLISIQHSSLPLFLPPPPHPLHTHWNLGPLRWVLCCTGKEIFFFFFKVSLCLSPSLCVSLSFGVCACACDLNRMQGICCTWVSSYWQCFILHVEMGGVVVRFHFTLMNLPSPQWSVNSFHCGYETSCVMNRERTQGCLRELTSQCYLWQL